MKKLLLALIILAAGAGLSLAYTPTDTPTPGDTNTFTPTPVDTFTSTPTGTVTPTINLSDTVTDTDTVTPTETDTVTPTITPTYTITPTWTPWPVMAATPQENVFAYPNPAKSGGRMAVAYPVDSVKTAYKVMVTIYGADGSYAAKAEDDGPSFGYTVIDISKFSRGVYIFKVVISYTDGTEQALPMRKFAVVK